MASLRPKQRLFVNAIAKGIDATNSARIAGYRHPDVQGSQLMHKEKIMRALDAKGLTDNYIAKELKKNIKAGSGVKADANVALRAIEMIATIRGYTNKPETNITNNTMIINELFNLDDNELEERANGLINDVKQINNLKAV